MAAVARHPFYAAFALVMSALVIIAFARTYYLRAWFDVPPITLLLHAHALNGATLDTARVVNAAGPFLARVGRMLGTKLDWTQLEAFLPATQDPQFRRSALASSFVAAPSPGRRNEGVEGGGSIDGTVERRAGAVVRALTD